MTVGRAREILGSEAVDLTDAEVEAIVAQVGDLVALVLEPGAGDELGSDA